MNYSRRQLEALGEPFGDSATRNRPGGFGRIYGGGMFGGGGGGGGSGGGEPAAPVPTRVANPQPISPYISAGGGFLGRGAPTTPSISENQFNANYYLKQNPDVAKDSYYGQNPFQHYQDFGFAERRSPFEGFQYNPSQQRMFDASGQLTGQGIVAAMTTSPEFQRRQEFQRAYTEAFRPGYKEFGPNQQYYQPIYQSGSSYVDYRNPMYSSGPFGGSYGYGASNPFSTTQGSYGSVAAAPRAAATNMIGGIGTGGRYAEGGEIDDNPGDDEGIRALLGRQ